MLGGFFTSLSNYVNARNNVNRFKFYIIAASSMAEAKDLTDYANLAVITLDGIAYTRYENRVDAPTQPLENRQFSNDSIMDNPFTFYLKGVISQGIFTSDDVNADKESILINTLNNIMKAGTLLAVLRQKPLFSDYINVILVGWTFEQTPDNISLQANLLFREIRTTYDPSNTSNDSFNAASSSNPTNATNVDNGFIPPINPAGDITQLNELVS